MWYRSAIARQELRLPPRPSRSGSTLANSRHAGALSSVLARAIMCSLAAVLLLPLCSCSVRRGGGPGVVDADAPTEFTTTESGLRYRILRKSDGAKPKPTDRVTVDYAGRLDDGSIFDSSYNRREPSSFALNQVVRGWTEGLQLIGEGGMIELEIPPDLGYGPEGRPPSIPPNSTLHFKVELHRID